MIYSFYGLTLESAVAIPVLQSIQQTAETSVSGIRFEEGHPAWAVQVLASDAADVPTLRSRGHEDEPPRFALKTHGGGEFFQLIYGDGTRFLVDRSTTRVWGEPGPGLSREDVFVYLVGPIAGFVLRRRGRMALHASAVRVGRRAIALMGPAGAGKSTTAAALALRNWQVCCEDVCALHEDGMRFFVVPGYPRVCLWPDSVRMLFSRDDALPLIVAGWGKRYLALNEQHGGFAESPTRLGAIYFLAPSSDGPSALRIRTLSKREAALRLVQNTYMNWLLDRQQRALEFDAIIRLVSKTQCFEVIPHADPSRLYETATLVEKHALSLPLN